MTPGLLWCKICGARLGAFSWDGYCERCRRPSKQPRRWGIADYLLLIARSDPGRVARVPASAIPEEGVDPEGEFAFVACPCGARPVARGELQQCEGCERRYVCLGPGSVFVAYGAMEPPVRPAA